MTDLSFKLRFLVLPDFIYSDNRLNASDIKVYSFINSYKGEKFYFTNDQLGKMFCVSEDSISRAMVRLEKFSYIEIDYEIKSGGGKIRFVRNRKVAESETAKLWIKKPQSRRDKDNKVKDNKLKSTTNKKYSSLKDLGEDDFQEIADRYGMPVSFIRTQYEKLVNYCEAKGRVYKNYKAALGNFVVGDITRNGGMIKPKPVVVEVKPVIEQSFEEREKARKKIEDIRKNVISKLPKMPK
jgi:hypothetical protein